MAIAGILTTFGVWLLFFPAICGWGSLLVAALDRAARGKVAPRKDVFAMFWMGFAAIIGGLQLWHLFRRVDSVATICFLVPGYLGFVWFLRSGRPAGQAAHWKAGLFLAIPVLVWIANLAIYGPDSYDSGLYHFSSVRWVKEFPIVPGLGNLQGRFAFNQSYFLFVALLDGVLANHGYHFASSLLAAVLAVQFFTASHELLTKQQGCRPDLFAQFLLLSIALMEMSGLTHYTDLSTPSPDLPVFILGIVLFVRLIAQIFPAEPDAAPSLSDVLTIATLSAAAVTLKLSFLAGGCAFVTVSCLLARFPKRGDLKTAAAVFLPGAVLFVSWIFRGVMTSGYPAYPSTFGALPVDWRIPTASTTAMSRVIQAWARMPDLPVNEVPGNWAWLGPWSLRVWQMPGVKLSVLLLAVSAVLLCAAWVFGRRGKRGGASWLWVFVPPVAALIFWMATAPDPRFAGAMPWLLSVALVLLAAGRFDERQFRRALQTIAPSVALAVGVFLVFDASRSQTWKLRGGFAKIPKAEMQTRITASGVEVQVPLQGDQVWNSKLPAAPALDPHLQMRGAGLANGFRVSADE